MNCPQCGKEMNNESYWYSGFGGWDDDYPSSYCSIYVCKYCNISCREGEWNVPEQLRPTWKQMKTAKYISNVLNIPEPAPTKRSLWQFINRNLNEAIHYSRYGYDDDLRYEYEEQHF